MPGVDSGERVRVRLTADGRGRAIGLVQAILRPSTDRVDPGCDQAARCPGCPLRHLRPARQRALKAKRLERALRGEGVPPPALEWLPAPPRDGYRARAVARVFPGEGPPVLGMASLDGNRPIDLARCPAQTPGVRALLAATARELERRAGQVRHVVIHEGAPGHARVVLALEPDADPAEGFRDVLGDRPGVTLLVDRMRRDDHRTLIAPERLRGSAQLRLPGGLRATLPAWTPQSPGSIAALLAGLLELLAPGPEDRVIELGCGVGTLSLPLAVRVAALIGVDRDRSAISSAAANAVANDLSDKTTFRQGRADHAIRRLLAGGTRAELLVLHAMRRPFGPRLMGILPPLGARRIVYIGPSPRSLAEDLGALPRHRLDRLLALDQMPGTSHFTTLAALTPASRSAAVQ